MSVIWTIIIGFVATLLSPLRSSPAAGGAIGFGVSRSYVERPGHQLQRNASTIASMAGNPGSGVSAHRDAAMARSHVSELPRCFCFTFTDHPTALASSCRVSVLVVDEPLLG
jgi:hypothetical protein